MDDPRILLVQFLQSRLRQVAGVQYREIQSHPHLRYALIIGRATWMSQPAAESVDCKKHVAAQAFRDLVTTRNETELRYRLGLPPRAHSRVCDSIRDQLRAEKQRLKNLAPGQAREAERMKIVEIYLEVDKLEKMMLTFGTEN